MANLLLRHIYKIYPGVGKAKKNAAGEAKKRSGDFVAVKDFNMEINDGEFIVFVGPSGCGKSTTLRMIAGLEEISGGELYIGDQLVNDVDAKDRDIAMVFQSYALYPHLTAYGNIAFGLKMRKIPVPKLDKAGEQIIDIDKKKLRTANKKLKTLSKKMRLLIKELAVRESRTELLDKAVEQFAKQVADATDAKVAELAEKLENAKRAKEKNENDILYYKEEHALAEKHIKDAKAEVEYYKSTPVPIFKYVHMRKSEIDEKVRWAAGVLGIEELLDSKPSEMSGGQRQRIALGRAMVRGPKVFLLDEPLSNLDAKLRTAMRAEIVKLHNQLKTTFIYVTHDQIEAMTMGTRIVVMKLGVVQQIDTPTNLFDYPENKFVAGFIGTPQMNFFDATLSGEGGKVYAEFENSKIELTQATVDRIIGLDDYLNTGKPMVMGVRPEDIHDDEEFVGANQTKTVEVIVDQLERLGAETLLYCKFESDGDELRLGDDAKKPMVAKVDGRTTTEMGQAIKLAIDTDHIHLFDKESELSVLEGEGTKAYVPVYEIEKNMKAKLEKQVEKE